VKRRTQNRNQKKHQMRACGSNVVSSAIMPIATPTEPTAGRPSAAEAL
jgi:hypothetical protein